MMYMATLEKSVNQINRLLKDFLLGFDLETGKRKMPLVSWSCLTQPKDKGDLGFKNYIAYVNALLSKWIARALEDPTTKWATLYMSLAKELTWEQRRIQNRAQYTNSNRFLFGSIKSSGTMTYTVGLWKAWEALNYHLFLNLGGQSIPAHWCIYDIINVVHPFSSLGTDQTISLTKTLGKLGVLCIEHLWNSSSNSWKTLTTRWPDYGTSPTS